VEPTPHLEYVSGDVFPGARSCCAQHRTSKTDLTIAQKRNAFPFRPALGKRGVAASAGADRQGLGLKAKSFSQHVEELCLWEICCRGKLLPALFHFIEVLTDHLPSHLWLSYHVIAQVAV